MKGCGTKGAGNTATRESQSPVARTDVVNASDSSPQQLKKEL